MRKNILVFLAMLLLPVLSFGQGFYTEGATLKDANGNKFVMKGLNVPLAWYVSQTNEHLDAIAEVTGANCMRIVVETSTSDNAWQTAVEKCIENEVVPMVELHSVTGSNDTVRLREMAQWWASKASFLTRPDIARYVLVNIANEWGDWSMASPNHSPSSVNWRDAYIRCINIMRNAGIRTTIVIDAPAYGQDSKMDVLKTHGPSVLEADPENNILFSVHMYCEWAIDANSSIAEDLPSVKEAGLPVIVGEFGWKHDEGNTTCDIDENLILSTCEQHDIGWLAWSWIGNSGGVEYLDMAEYWDGSVLTEWGQTVVHGEYGSQTAIKASVFGSPENENPTVSIISPESDEIFPSSNEIIIEVSADDSDGTVTEVVFYNGSELLHKATEEPFTYTWSGVEDGVYSLTAMARDNNNGVSFSHPVRIRVGEEPAPENQIANNEFDQETMGWTIQNTGVANGTFSVVTDAEMSGENSLRICTTNPGEEDWHIQVLHNVELEAGKEYEISFMAKADENRSLGIGIQQNGGDWTVYYNNSVNLNTTPQEYTFTFVPDITDKSAQFKFFTGLSDACVYLDKVVFKEKSDVTNITDDWENERALSVYPNPFTSTIRVKADHTISEDLQVKLLKTNGKLLFKGKVSAEFQEINLPENLRSGIYLLLIQGSNYQKVIKVMRK